MVLQNLTALIYQDRPEAALQLLVPEFCHPRKRTLSPGQEREQPLGKFYSSTVAHAKLTGIRVDRNKGLGRKAG